MIRDDPMLPDRLKTAINLASPRLGTEVVEVTDEFFGARARMLADGPAVFYPDRYDDHGKWMDGWETRRRRDSGHDVALIRLGAPGVIAGVEIDTSHFTGNYPRAAALEACDAAERPGDDADWRPLLPAQSLGPSQRHVFMAEPLGPVHWVRLHIYPDGGVARLRLYGAPYRAWAEADPTAEHELSALANGGRIVGYSDAHYGAVWALLSEGRGRNMGDGWETRRRREPGADWIVIQLGHVGRVTALEIDTAHFKGNFPHRASVEAARATEGTDASVITQSMFWPTLLAPQPLQADHVHRFALDGLAELGPVSHVKLTIFPDGGVSRLRVFGTLAR